MKRILVFSLLILSFIGCQEGNNLIKLDSLSNTYWESTLDALNYGKIWFYADGKCKYIICADGQVDTHQLNWTCSAQGDVVLSMTVWTSEKTIETGKFDKEKCTLQIGKLNYTYKGPAQ